MKKQLGYLAFAACTLALQACGGSMLGTSDSEEHKLVPDPVEGNEGRPRPSENAAIITTDGNTILDATGEPVLLRGINLQYGDAPLDRIDGVTSIGEVGSNVVRLQLRSDTSADDLETALLAVADAGMIAIVSYWEPEVACAADDQVLFGAVTDLWLNEWIPILVQDRFQPNIMLNLASKWGPDGIFNSYSMGYRVYIDNYKSVIRQIRRAGFRNPIVIDAPGCGRDYHAFMGNRGRELLAADDEENIVLSVHAYGSNWRGADDVAAAMEQLNGENMPVVMSEFGDVNMEEDGVRHTDIMVQGAGNYAAELAVDWQTDADKAGYVAVLDEPLNVIGREVSMQVYLDAAYVESEAGFLGMQMYLRDSEDRYANLGWNSADAMEPDSWNTLKRVIQDNASFGWAQEGFDASAITKMGIELVANGKSPEVGGDIRIDNIKVIEASVPETLGSFTFDSDVDGWYIPWTETQISYEDGAMGLARAASNDQVIAESPALEGVSFDGEVQVSARVMIPESYAAETEGLYFKFFSNDAGWQETNTLSQDQFSFGEWSEVTVSGAWSGGSRVGIQMGNLAGSQEPVLFDDIVVMGMPEQQVAVEWGTQYQSDYSEGTDGWGVLGWHTLPVSVSAEDGTLVMSPRPSEVDDSSDDNNTTFAVQKNDLSSVENFDLTSEELTMTVSLQLDAAYADAPEDFEFRVFIQDANWSNHTNLAVWTLEDLTPGEWNTMEFDMVLPDEFERNGTPQHFGFQVAGVADIPDSPITVGEVRIEGYIPLEVEEDVVELIDFHYPAHLESMEVDFVEGGLVAEDLMANIGSEERSGPFGWLAWSWIGNPEGLEVLDMSNSEATSVDLTERGEQIVYGKGGIEETSVPANFPSTE